ncbi:MAG: XdhC family protein [Xenococcaceae cyanobacterium]
MSDRIFYQKLKYRLASESVVLATIVKVMGSAPREVGAKMAICQYGNIIGTIGGGAGEAKVIKQALQVLKTGEKQFVELDLTGTPGKEIQGVCGGKVRVWLEKWSGKKAIDLVEEILELFKTGQSAQLITPFTREARPYLISDRNLTKKNASPAPLHPRTPAPFIERIQPPPILLIIGAGHVAVSLAQIASLAGFQIIVQDDRPEFVTPLVFL